MSISWVILPFLCVGNILPVLEINRAVRAFKVAVRFFPFSGSIYGINVVLILRTDFWNDSYYNSVLSGLSSVELLATALWTLFHDTLPFPFK